MSGRQDTIVAVATPPGAGGIGIVRLSGADSLDIGRRISRLGEIPPRHAHYCTFRDRDDRIIDRGILLYFKAPHSFTGEDVVEFQGHGGRVVLDLLLKEALELGARPARAGEFTERAYLNGRLDLVQAEAVADLIESGSAQAARSAARSLEGDFSGRIKDILEELVTIRVLVEGSLDFPEEEIDFLKDAGPGRKLADVITRIERLLLSSQRGRRLREGLRAAIIGRPNVGKSSLMNTLTRTNRAIVTEIAGTTRDVIEDVLHIDGLNVNIVDTAGIRAPGDEVEREGVRRSLAEIEKADILLLVTDRMHGTPDDITADQNTAAAKRVTVHNKIDVHGRGAGMEEEPDGLHVYLSAKTGEGIDLLAGALRSFAGAEAAGEDVVLARERHIRSLMAAKRFVEAGVEVYEKGGGPELLAEELVSAQKALGEITGEFHTEDLLGEIFSRFCIGK